jgi:hypothetical protein
MWPSSVKGSRKLESKVRGPWTVLHAVGNDVNYLLQLDGSKMQRSLHVSRMFRYFVPAKRAPVDPEPPASNAKWDHDVQAESNGAPALSGGGEAVAGVVPVREQLAAAHAEAVNAVQPRVFVAQSTIPGAGRGLFARVDIPRDSLVVEYKGELLTKRRFNQRYPADDARYSFALAKGFLDASDPLKANAARYINCPGEQDAPNCEAQEHERRVFIMATRDIAAGEELLFDYGPGYFWEYPRAGLSGERRALPPPPVPVQVPVVPVAEGPDVVPSVEPEAPASGPEPVLTPAADRRLREGDVVRFFDDDDELHRVAKVLSLDSLGEFVELHVYGTYAKGFRAGRWLPSFVDPKDGKLVFTAKPMPRYDPWLWKIPVAEVCSAPFALKRGRVPKTLSTCSSHADSEVSS